MRLVESGVEGRETMRIPSSNLAAAVRSGVVVAVAALPLAACFPDPPAPGGARATVDEEAVLTAVRAFQGSPAFVRLNQAAYATALESKAPINVYVSSHAFAPYASIVPESEGSEVQLPKGTLIVRQVKGATAAADTLTLMYKGPPGYNDELGDYWFGVTDARGVPQIKDGKPRTGQLAECYGCHLDRVEDDFLFGVPAAMR
jgi:hypothetical protein